MNNSPSSIPDKCEPQSVATAVSKPEYGLHWLMLAMGCLVFVLSLWMSSDGETQVFLPGASLPLPDICTSKRVLGFDCPGCGLTRAFIAISHGQFQRAWQFNPASFLVYLLIVGQVPWQIYQLSRVHRGYLTVMSNWIYVLPALAAAGLIVQWMAKIFGSL